MATPNLEVHRVAGALGAEIHGINLAQEHSEATIAAVRGLLLEHGVIFFRNQQLDGPAQKRFAGRFGSFFRHPYFLPEDDPDIITIRRAPGDTRIVGEDWHSDTPATLAPPIASMLYGVNVPPYGGDTMFANQYLAYETLSPAMQAMIAPLRAVYSDSKVSGAKVGRNAKSATKTREDAEYRHTEGIHPVVRTHPETGRKALYLIDPLMLRFDGMSDAESAGLQKYLYEHSHRPEFTCRFRWENGSVAFWDNRCTQHIALNDTGPFHRVMQRIQLAGDAPQ